CKCMHGFTSGLMCPLCFFLCYLFIELSYCFLPCQWRMDCETPLNLATLSQIGMGKALRSKPMPLAIGGSITSAFFCCIPLTMEATTFSVVSIGVNNGLLTPSNIPVSI